MAFILSARKDLVEKLVAAGIMPPQCVSLELSMAVNEIVTIKAVRYASAAEVEKLFELLASDPEAAKGMARDITFRDLQSGKSAQVKF